MNFSCDNPALKVLHQQGNIPTALSKQKKVWNKQNLQTKKEVVQPLFEHEKTLGPDKLALGYDTQKEGVEDASP